MRPKKYLQESCRENCTRYSPRRRREEVTKGMTTGAWTRRRGRRVGRRQCGRGPVRTITVTTRTSKTTSRSLTVLVLSNRPPFSLPLCRDSGSGRCVFPWTFILSLLLGFLRKTLDIKTDYYMRSDLGMLYILSTYFAPIPFMITFSFYLIWVNC